MPSNYLTDDPIQGQIDLDDKFITDAWLVDQFVGGALFSWGYNAKGLLGNGTTISYSSPIQVGSLTNWKQLSCGGQYSQAAIKTDGTLWTCGYNGSGQLGNGSISARSSPIPVGLLTNWKQVSISATTQYVAAIKTDGTLWTWGGNSSGALGNGTVTNYSSPIQVGSLTNWKQVSAGQAAAAIKTDGTLWMWGQNNTGQLGNGTTINYSSPVQIGSLTNWKQVSCGISYTVAIKTDGTLWTWGQGAYGGLGNGTTINYSSPIQIGSLTNWKQVSAGFYNFVGAIKTDGTLWTWGNNGDSGASAGGVLGNGTVNTYYSSPIQIGSLTSWKQVDCGSLTMGAIKTDGTLWMWGWNTYGGQLGNGTIVNYSSPIQIGLLTNWKRISCGYVTSAITFKDIG